MNELAAIEMGADTQGQDVSIAHKYDELRRTIVELYDARVWFLTEAALSVHVSCLLEDTTNPLALIFVGGPSTEKTTVLDFFEGLAMNYRIDKFTPASFLTQAAQVKKDKLKNIDLLPKIIYKTMQVPEMAPTFNQPKEVLLENYALLARVLDGCGLVSAGGIHGERRLTGDYIFALLGATTPLSQTAWNAMSKVGSRLIFLNTNSKVARGERRKRAKGIMTAKVHYKTKRKQAREAIAKFLTFFFKQYEPHDYTVPDDVPEELGSKVSLLNHCGYLPRAVTWDRSTDDSKAIDAVAMLAEFLTACRQDIRVWTERTEDGHQETNSTGAITEGVDRFTAIIYNLARCHALVCGRTNISTDDLPLVVAVALSSLPDDRRCAVELLIDPDAPHKESEPGQFTIKELMSSMSCSDKTAKIIMRKLQIAGIGQVKGGHDVQPQTFHLHDDYSWFTEEEFQGYFSQWVRGGAASDSPTREPEPEEEETPF